MTPTMLWDPNFTTWQMFGVRANSQMMLISPDLDAGSDLIFGFSPEQQEAILTTATDTWPTGG